MRIKNVFVFLCTCSLFIGGCGTSQTTENKNTAQPDALQTVQSQPDSETSAENSTIPYASSGNTTTPDAIIEDTAQPDKTHASGGNNEEPDGGAANKTGITEQRALDIALKHAGVKESELTLKRIKKDTEDGVEVYDVEFYVGEKEYDYEIGISDGRIIKSDFEIDDDFNSKKNNQAGKEISINEAKKIALNKVPGAKQIKIKKDMDDGKVVYEGEIYYNNVEYEFEIDALTGKVVSWEEDDD